MDARDLMPHLVALRPLRPRGRPRGTTLVELLVVIAIIVILLVIIGIIASRVWRAVHALGGKH